jgi:hypothetical protein
MLTLSPIGCAGDTVTGGALSSENKVVHSWSITRTIVYGRDPRDGIDSFIDCLVLAGLMDMLSNEKDC